MSSKGLIVKDHGTDKIVITDEINTIVEVDLQELHMKQDGAIDDKGNDQPSLLFVSRLSTITMLGQVSLRMLIEAFEQLGYKIVKNNTDGLI